MYRGGNVYHGGEEARNLHSLDVALREVSVQLRAQHHPSDLAKQSHLFLVYFKNGLFLLKQCYIDAYL
jgi:hypothetical protein